MYNFTYYIDISSINPSFSPVTSFFLRPPGRVAPSAPPRMRAPRRRRSWAPGNPVKPTTTLMGHGVS